LWGLRKENFEIQASLGYIARTWRREGRGRVERGKKKRKRR
jgi:hypothetical protein